MSTTQRVFYAGRMRTLEAIERRRQKNREWSYRMYWDDLEYRRRKLVMNSIRGAEKTIAKYTELLERMERCDTELFMETHGCSRGDAERRHAEWLTRAASS